MAIYGYARCSTNESKQDIDRQRRELVKAGVPAKNIHFEYESGTNEARAQLALLLETVSEGDTIVSTEVSRLTRSTQHLCKLIELVQQKKLQLTIIGSISIDCRNGGGMDPMTKAFLQMAGVFSELERDIISGRVKSGMANAKAKGKILGRPERTAENIPTAFLRQYPKYKAGQLNIAELSRVLGMSRTTVYKYIRLLEE